MVKCRPNDVIGSYKQRYFQTSKYMNFLAFNFMEYMYLLEFSGNTFYIPE